MNRSVRAVFESLFSRYACLAAARESVIVAYDILSSTFAGGNRLMVCGNGGSAADSQHIVGELMKSFRLSRAVDEGFASKARLMFGEEAEAELCGGLEGALPAISLVGENALYTAFANDRCADHAFAQQVYGLGSAGDSLMAISTSGNSRNVVYAAQAAKAKGMSIVSLTGASESRISALSDVCIRVPATETYKVQELHLPVYHALCAALEEGFFGC